MFVTDGAKRVAILDIDFHHGNGTQQIFYERGDVLFEIAPLEDYRVVLKVDERDIRDVAQGQHGELLLQSFGSDIRDLRSILETILTPETHAALNATAQIAPAELRFPDELWVATVYQFLAAHHAGVMRREHITQALLPLYLGRAGAFMLEHAGAAPASIDAALDELCREFERAKPYLVQRWARTQPR